MASETPGDTAVSVSLPESLSHWLDDKASTEDRTREDVLLQLVSAYRKIDGLEEGVVDPPDEIEADGLDQLPTELRREFDAMIEERVEERLDEAQVGGDAPTDAVESDVLDERLNVLQRRFMNLLEDVRERVVQVKRETDGKAPVDHGHQELEHGVAEIEAMTAEVETLSKGLADLESRLDAGFDNYEEVLEYLADSIDRVSGRQSTLAQAIVETRQELRKLAARDSARSAAESLKRSANQHGISTALCELCETTVDVGLLTRSQCPHCSATFVGVEPSNGFFGSDTLVTGDRPALEGGGPTADGFEHGVSEIIESDDERPQVGVDDESGGGDSRDGESLDGARTAGQPSSEADE